MMDHLNDNLSIRQKLMSMSWSLIILTIILAGIGFLSLYSAAGGDVDPWASRQFMRFVVGVIALFVVAMIDIKYWYQLAYPIYGVGFLSLIVVEVMGHTGMGAQRWINLGFMQLQPSEFMKIATVLALARYFHGVEIKDIKRLKFLIVAALIIAAPVGLVLLQPDLGTSLMIIMASVTLIFVAGAPLWIFISGGVLTLAAIPMAWLFMHDYQKQRVRTFLDPESDPLGAGYHITQSKIALGSGGIDGKGFLEGTQSRLNFLPEKQTDFIFTLWAEEWGLFGGLFLLLVVSLIILVGSMIANRCKHIFGRLLAVGLTMNFFLYVFINIGMVMGLMPVVGAPLPLVSYGGTSMLAILISFGLLQSCNIHRYSKRLRAL